MDAPLAGDVGKVAGLRVQRYRGARTNDAPPTGSSHAGNEGLRKQDKWLDVDRLYVLPDVERHCLEVSDGENRRVVDEDVAAPEAVKNLVCDRRDLVRLAYIADHGGLVSAAGKGGDDKRRVFDVDRDHVGAIDCEALT